MNVPVGASPLRAAVGLILESYSRLQGERDGKTDDS